MYKNLYNEIQAIASESLSGVLGNWNNLEYHHRAELRAFLAAEMKPYGMLSVEKGRECDTPMGQIRLEARALLTTL